MKKSHILLVFLLLVGLNVQAQLKLGLKFSPTLVSTRTFIQSDEWDVLPADRSFKFALGLIADYGFTETYFVSSGLLVVPKRVGLEITPEGSAAATTTKEFYDLQYVQIPLTLKLYTNEIAPDASMYFQVGATMDLKVFEQPVEEGFTFIEEFQGIDASAILGGGFEYKAGLNTVLFLGATYNRGLANIVKTTQSTLPEDFYIRTSVLMFDFGIKF